MKRKQFFQTLLGLAAAPAIAKELSQAAAPATPQTLLDGPVAVFRGDAFQQAGFVCYGPARLYREGDYITKRSDGARLVITKTDGVNFEARDILEGGTAVHG